MKMLIALLLAWETDITPTLVYISFFERSLPGCRALKWGVGQDYLARYL